MILKNPKLFVWIIAPRSVQGSTVLPAEPEILCVFHMSQTRAAYNPTSYLWLLKRFRFQFQQRNCTLGGQPSITWECTQKASGSGPWLNQVQEKPPRCDIQTSIQHKVVFVPFMKFMQRQVHFIHFEVFGNKIQNGSFSGVEQVQKILGWFRQIYSELASVL